MQLNIDYWCHNCNHIGELGEEKKCENCKSSDLEILPIVYICINCKRKSELNPLEGEKRCQSCRSEKLVEEDSSNEINQTIKKVRCEFCLEDFVPVFQFSSDEAILCIKCRPLVY